MRTKTTLAVRLVTRVTRVTRVDSPKTLSVFVVGAYVTKVKMSRVVRKQTFWFPTWSDTNQAVQLQKIDRGLKFRV